MNEFSNFIKDFWVAILPVLSAIAISVRWFLERKDKNRKIKVEDEAALKEYQENEELNKVKIENELQSSTELLIDQLENLKKKIVISFTNEIRIAESNAEKSRFIMMLQKHCPECYEEVKEKIKYLDTKSKE